MSRKVLYNRQLGVITASYNHTYDVYLFKKKHTVNVRKDLIKVLKKTKKEKIKEQLKNAQLKLKL